MRRWLERGASALLLASLGGGLPAHSEPDVAARPPIEDRAPTGPSVSERLEAIALQVQRALVYPELARSEGVEGEARLSFEIDANGHPSRVELVESSGSQRLDRAARRALAEAGTLPYVVGRVTVPVRFALAGDE